MICILIYEKALPRRFRQQSIFPMRYLAVQLDLGRVYLARMLSEILASGENLTIRHLFLLQTC